jgi:cation diffusion facilitator CzcD-associated flavoprotein CzcO
VIGVPRLPVLPVRTLLRLTSPLLTGAGVEISEQRRRVELAGRLLQPPHGTAVTQTTLGGVPAERLTGPGMADDGALLYLHGGGYCIGSPTTHRALAATLASEAGITAYVPDYRLAPEHPHPSALTDALDSYKALLERGLSPDRIAVAGDSAGGGLALALALTLRDEDLPLPAAVAMICPWLDLRADHQGTRASSSRDPLLSTAALTLWARAYAGQHDPALPAISPLLGDLSGLPPLILHTAGDDTLASDGERLSARADGIEHRRIDGLWHVPHALVGLLGAADEALTTLGTSIQRRLRPSGPRVAIVGAGMSGLCMGESLKRAGIGNFTIYEKAEEVGGTWRENRYPGLTCDVPSRFYSYSFAPNPAWTKAFSPGPEIQEYFVRTARERGLRERVEFGAEVTSARWLGDRWQLETGGGATDEAEFLVTATGVLHHPRVPAIPGAETFAGTAFHSARWDGTAGIEGKRVAVIGNGSTGVQITVALGGVTERLLLFQRTPQWIMPVPNRSYSPLAAAAMSRMPALNRLAYRFQQQILELILGPAVTRPSWQRTAIASACRANLRLSVRDPELRARLTPDYEPMCKRLVMSAGFYRAVQRDDVELVTTAIDHIEPRGIVTDDGELHELDVIVYATGFDPHAYMRPMEIAGEDGVTLEQAWAGGPRAYLTVAIPGFPNLFTLMGPHSPIGNHSLIAVAEAQAHYIVEWIERAQRERIVSVAPTQAATDAYYEKLKAALPGTVWVTGCESWYLDADGDPELWPWTPARHRRMLADVRPAHYATRRSASVQRT